MAWQISVTAQQFVSVVSFSVVSCADTNLAMKQYLLHAHLYDQSAVMKS